MIDHRERQIILVGPWRSDNHAGGCCSADTNSLALPNHDHPAEPSHPDAERLAAGRALGALRDQLGPAADVQLVDPRNTFYLLPTVYRAARSAGLNRTSACAEAVKATTPWSLIIDGRVVSRGNIFDPAEAIRLLAR